jgi:hypothetical protein
MATAAVISFEDAREALAKTRPRPQLHGQLDRWLDGLAAHVADDSASLEALTQAVCARRQELTGTITEALVAPRHAPRLHQRLMPCPHGQRLLPARPAPPRPVHTLVGEVALSRPDCYGRHCQQGFAPLDDALQRSGRRTPWDWQQAAARRAAAVPCATAQALCTPLTGRSWSAHTSHAVAGELSHGLGGLDVSPTAAEMAQRVGEEMAAGKTWRPIMVLASEGACVPTRPEQAKGRAASPRRPRARRAGWQGAWQEAQGLRCSLVDQARMVHVLRWSQVGSEEAVGAALQRVKDAGLIPEDRVRLCVMGEGAKWLWNQVTALVPTAVPSLDSYHGRAHVHKGGGRPCGAAAVPARAWVEAMRARRCWGSVAWAMAGLEALQPRDDPATEAIRKRIGCLRNTAKRLHDRTARQGGDPLGSGGIESANQRLSHVRLKRSGAWWYLAQANPRLALRCAIYNGTCERIFEAYKGRALQRHGGDLR